MEGLTTEQPELSLEAVAPAGAALCLHMPGFLGEARWECAERSLAYRNGIHGDVFITRAEVARIRQWPSGNLVVEAEDGARAIAVPANLPGFAELRDRLMRWHAFETVPQEDFRLAVAVLAAAVIPMCWVGPAIGNLQSGNMLNLLYWSMVIAALEIGPVAAMLTRPSRVVKWLVRGLTAVVTVRALQLLLS